MNYDSIKPNKLLTADHLFWSTHCNNEHNVTMSFTALYSLQNKKNV